MTNTTFNIFNIVAKDGVLQFLLNDHISSGNRDLYNSVMKDHLEETYPRELEFFVDEHDLDAEEIVEDLIIVWRGLVAGEGRETGINYMNLTIIHDNEVNFKEEFCLISREFEPVKDRDTNTLHVFEDRIYAEYKEDVEIIKTEICMINNQFEEDLEAIGHKGYLSRYLKRLEQDNILYHLRESKGDSIRITGSLYESMTYMLNEWYLENEFPIVRALEESESTLCILTKEELDAVVRLLTGSKV